MMSMITPTLIIAAVLLSCLSLAGPFGVAMASTGLLSTLGLTLATDAYGPVADNAGGIAESECWFGVVCWCVVVSFVCVCLFV
jgi:K(+)-stimulated pyrophosphate-energized sodium pump